MPEVYPDAAEPWSYPSMKDGVIIDKYRRNMLVVYNKGSHEMPFSFQEHPDVLLGRRTLGAKNDDNKWRLTSAQSPTVVIEANMAPRWLRAGSAEGNHRGPGYFAGSVQSSFLPHLKYAVWAWEFQLLKNAVTSERVQRLTTTLKRSTGPRWK